MGNIDKRIQELEKQFAVRTAHEPSESFTHLRYILDELAALKASSAHGFRGGVPIVPEYIALTDKLGNQSVIAAPGIEFRVEGSSKDRQGPALLDWSFA